MNATYTLTIASAKMLFRNWSSLVFTFLLPMMILLGAGFLPHSGPPKVMVGVAEGAHDAAGARLTAGLRHSALLAVREGPLEQLKAELVAGKLSAVVQLPAVLDQQAAALRVYTNSAQAAMVEVATSVLSRQLQLAVGAPRDAVALDERPLESKEIRYIRFLLPGIIGLGVMQMCIFSVAPVFVFYRERGIMKRLLATPMKPHQFIVSNSMARLLVACLQALAFLSVGALVFDTSPNGSLGALALTVVMGAVMFLGMGFSLAGIASSVESAPVLANLATFPMVFVGGTFFPLGSMPGWLQTIANGMPLTHFSAALRAIMNDGAGIADVGQHLMFIAAWAAAFIAIAIVTFRVRFARAS